MDIHESFTGKIGKIINNSFSIGTLPKVKRLELQVLGVAHAGDYCERLCCPRRHDWICSRGNMYTDIYIYIYIHYIYNMLCKMWEKP